MRKGNWMKKGKIKWSMRGDGVKLCSDYMVLKMVLQ